MKRPLIVLLALFCLHLSCFAARFSFAVFGDNRDGDQVFMEIVKRMNKDGSIQFAVNTGDLTPKGSASEYEKYWKMCSASKVTIYDVIGNHDLGLFNTGVGIFKKKYGETYYYFDKGNARFILIDNNRSRGMGRKQWTWLREALNTDKMIFVFLHKPVIDSTGMYPNYLMLSKDERESLNKLFIRSKVKYVFAGHIHGYGKEVADGITYIITGAAGAPLYLPAFNGGYFSYVKVTVDGASIKDEVVKLYE